VCDDYRVDMRAQVFGDCVCGFPKAAHTMTQRAAPPRPAAKSTPPPMHAELEQLSSECSELEERQRAALAALGPLRAAELPTVEAVAAQRAVLEAEAAELREEVERLSAEEAAMAFRSGRASTRSIGTSFSATI
jgi:hypothetical protein